MGLYAPLTAILSVCMQCQRVSPFSALVTRRRPTLEREREETLIPVQRCSYRFWQHAMNVAEHHPDDFKRQALPLARIKKVAKMDPELQVRRRRNRGLVDCMAWTDAHWLLDRKQNQMISSEVTVLFEKACQSAFVSFFFPFSQKSGKAHPSHNA